MIQPCCCWERQAPEKNSSRAPSTIAAVATHGASSKSTAQQFLPGCWKANFFGHERGAFTGAIAQKPGRMELADRGSLFLDEIGDIPLELQPKLLRVLQEREYERLGSTRTRKIDVRVVAATHRNLQTMIARKQFRSDLYYRLNVFPISIPPLRERPGDIPQLVRHFAQQCARKMNRVIDAIPCETMDALKQYSWPGNIRELENVIERAVILSPGSVLHVPVCDLDTRTAPVHHDERNQTLEEVERTHILTTLKETHWVLSGPRGAAARFGFEPGNSPFPYEETRNRPAQGAILQA